MSLDKDQQIRQLESQIRADQVEYGQLLEKVAELEAKLAATTDALTPSPERKQWTDQGLCPTPACCVAHRGPCGHVECALKKTDVREAH